MPSASAQYETIRKAYEAAALDPGQTLYVEAHGEDPLSNASYCVHESLVL